MELFEKTLEQEYKYEGRIINLRVDKAELPNGEECTREVVEHNGGVTIAALTDEGELLFVRQYRYPYSEVVLELPAGKLEKGEDPFKAGIRELKEETGAVASSICTAQRESPSENQIPMRTNSSKLKKFRFQQRLRWCSTTKFPTAKHRQQYLKWQCVHGTRRKQNESYSRIGIAQKKRNHADCGT